MIPMEFMVFYAHDFDQLYLNSLFYDRLSKKLSINIFG